ncbi:MAG: hypothetical protein Q4D14_02885 [Bacteroidales bacterium]|nr:hypothetical protein [Bacteroidales bacterium]
MSQTPIKERHFRFGGGITIDGHIDSTQRIFVAKGLTYLKDSTERGESLRLFAGTFHNTPARFGVYFIKNTGLVYRITVNMDYNDKQQTLKAYEQLRSQLVKQYERNGYCVVWDGEMVLDGKSYDAFPQFYISVKRDKNSRYCLPDLIYGSVILSIKERKYKGTTFYRLSIGYTDQINYEKVP